MGETFLECWPVVGHCPLPCQKGQRHDQSSKEPRAKDGGCDMRQWLFDNRQLTIDWQGRIVGRRWLIGVVGAGLALSSLGFSEPCTRQQAAFPRRVPSARALIYAVRTLAERTCVGQTCAGSMPRVSTSRMPCSRGRSRRVRTSRNAQAGERLPRWSPPEPSSPR
jgi:hypothetical protein